MRSGFDRKNIDAAVRPQDDFFQFAVGGWLKRNPIPKTESRWGSFGVLRDETWSALHRILARVARRPTRLGSERAKLKDFYLTAMDERARERQGIAPLKKYFALIDGINSRRAFFRVLGEFHAMGVYPFWTPIVDQDEKKSEAVVFHLWQAHLVMPDRDYYLKADRRSRQIQRQYRSYIVRLLALAGERRGAPRTIRSIMTIETALARASRPREALRDAEKQYHKMTLRSLTEKTPGIDWPAYFAAAGLPRLRYLIVGQPEFFRVVGRMAARVPLADLQTYLSWYFLDHAAGFLNRKLVHERFRFHGTVLTGAARMKPLWKRVTMTIDGVMGEALGKRYVRRYFRGSAKRKIDELVNRVVRAYASRIRQLDWMSPGTRRRALTKLTAIRRKIAYPKRWRDYGTLEVKTDSYLENFFRAQRFEHRREVAKIGRPLDRNEWFMTPPTVNAYYSPSLNEIVFPAGILQPPFFDARAFNAVNYGAIGSVIGHELTHGFDDQGSKFDADGNLREWWSKADRKKFVRKARVLVRQFDSYRVAGGVPLNGKLTLGENIADLGGLVIAYEAFRDAVKSQRSPQTIGGWTPEQLFFLGYAQMERGHARSEEERRLATIDPHSPARFRTNGVLANMGEFHRAFGVKRGDGMYRSPGVRTEIW